MRELTTNEVQEVSGGLCNNGAPSHFYPGATRAFIDMIVRECAHEGVQVTTSSTISGVYVNKIVGGTAPHVR